MVSDSFTEVTRQGWFSRIKDSFKGILTGAIFLLISVVLLFWNEGRAVKRHKALKAGEAAVVSVSSDEVTVANEGKLIHITGLAETGETLFDKEFGVQVNAIKLKRNVKMYQWHEKKESKSKKNVGGSKTTETTYSYYKSWSESTIDTSSFKKPEGHENPEMTYKNELFTAKDVTLGAFSLSGSLVAKISSFEPFPLDSSVKDIPDYLKEILKVHGDGFYSGDNPGNPQVGDMKISFQIVNPVAVSIVSVQSCETFKPYQAETGSVELLQTGTFTAQQMFEAAKSQNKMMTWILRLVGFILMLAGFSMIFKILSVLADVLPILGSIVSFGTGIIAFLLSISLSLIVIAIGWLFYRPLLGISLLALAGGVIFGIIKVLRKTGNKQAAIAGQPQKELS